MIATMVLTLAAQAAAPATVRVADPRMGAMAALYDEVCLKTFPDDAATDRLMTAKGATVLTPEQVRVTLVDDPGRGWTIADPGGRVLVILELPPYHACSVRWDAPAGSGDWTPYRAIGDAYIAAHPGFTSLPATEMDRGTVHIIATMAGRMGDKGTESLMTIDQVPADPARRATAVVDRRLVHQIRER